MPGRIKQTATSANRRALALEFIRRYFVDFGCSPSFGELAAALEVPVQRIGRIIQPIVDAGELLHQPGVPRSFKLPDCRDQLSDSELLLLLRRRGWTVNPQLYDGPTPAERVIKSALVENSMAVRSSANNDAGAGDGGDSGGGKGRRRGSEGPGGSGRMGSKAA